jgi:DtxR family transcriptional regulator, Mn-dependent transcriptional regulator
MAKDKKAKLSESLEDYLEAILNLSDASGITRAKDVAGALGVAKSSVTGALRQLAAKGLVNYRPYEYITLTKKGRSEAGRVAGKHGVLKRFFVDVMGIEPDMAQEAACRTEHALEPPVMSRLVQFVDFVMQPGEGGASLAGQFRNAYATSRAAAHGRQWQ